MQKRADSDYGSDRRGLRRGLPNWKIIGSPSVQLNWTAGLKKEGTKRLLVEEFDDFSDREAAAVDIGSLQRNHTSLIGCRVVESLDARLAVGCTHDEYVGARMVIQPTAAQRLTMTDHDLLYRLKTSDH